MSVSSWSAGQPFGYRIWWKTWTEDGPEESSDDEENVREEDYSSWAVYLEKSWLNG